MKHLRPGHCPDRLVPAGILLIFRFADLLQEFRSVRINYESHVIELEQ
jgi:hypothetical protein